MQAAVGLSRVDLERISRVLGHWAFLAQKRYFAEVHDATQNHDATGDATPSAQLLQKLSDVFREFESLRLQSEKVREALEAFDTAVVPHDSDEATGMPRQNAL